MKPAFLLATIFFLLPGTGTGTAGNSFAECGWEACSCKKNLFSLRAQLAAKRLEKPPGNGRQYARDRIVDVLHQKIDVTPDFEKRSIEGISTTTLTPIAGSIDEFSLDATDLIVSKIASSHPVESWDNDDRRIAIYFKDPVPAGKKISLTVHYSAEPKDGLYFRTEAMGYPRGDDHLWTQGEPEKHRYWFPGYDYPNERFTTEVICHVPESMIVLSNGTLVSDTVADGIRTTHWHQKKEHVNYLVSLIAGHFQKLEKSHGKLPLAFFTTPSQFGVAENSFRDTAKILPFLEKEIGVPFPWAKYYNVCVADFVAGGMENTSITTLTNNTLFSADSENLRTSHRLDAHEVTHQWFGDLLTCKDWSSLWLNEGFATYYTHLYEEHKNGRDAMIYGLFRDLTNVTGQKSDRPIVWRGFSDPGEQFDFRAYPKGSWVLHMLRSQLGPELYQKCIKSYVDRNRNRNVETDDLKDVLEEISGRSFDEFFDQWVYHGGTPHLDVKYQWDGKAKKAKLSIKQTQKVSEQVLLFDFKLPVRFIDQEGKRHDHTVRVQRTSEDFSFSIPSQPKIVRIDPDLTVLTRVNFTPPRELLNNQLSDQHDMVGRILAVRSLAKRKDAPSLQLLSKVLNEDSFYGVRVEAAKALAIHRTPEAFRVLQESRNQDDARVRIEVVGAITRYFSPEALQVLQKVAIDEKNPEIVAKALGTIGKYPAAQVSKDLIAALQRDSYRHRIAVSAINAMRAQADPTYVPALQKHLQAAEARFTTNDFGNALYTLAYLSRDAEKATKKEVNEFVTSFVNHPKTKLSPLAIRAVGATEDKQNLAVLQPLTTAGEDEDPVVKAANEAIRKINSGKKQADEVRDLRDQVSKLQKELDRIAKKIK